MARTALFNWAYARHTDGTFVFRIEDTDSARDSEESYQALLDALTWMGLDWDEGPAVGGPYEPYRQSERLDLYKDVAAQLLDGGHTYECFCTAEELEAVREAQRAAGKTQGYPGTCRNLTLDERAANRAEGLEPVIRFRMPEREEWTWDDLIRGPITFRAEHVLDFVVVRKNGEPLYTLVNPVDDATMHITHVLRGEDLLSSTPRQLAMHEALAALGVGSGELPRFGHLPYVMGEGNKKLSKRDPEASFKGYIDAGFLPEGLVNYLALLGWSPGGDVEFFSLAEMARDFKIENVNANPARFDMKKALAINGLWLRHLDTDELANRLVPYLQREGILSRDPSREDMDLLRKATPLINERLETMSQAPGMVGFLFGEVEYNDEARGLLKAEVAPILDAAIAALTDIDDWSTDVIHETLNKALVEDLGIKPRNAFTPIRVAVTGRRVSPPLFESMELLGRDVSLARIAAARAIGQ
jgi:glutamyl-tRNA synthetase